MILRKIGMADFTYRKFKIGMDKAEKGFNSDQLSGLEQRLEQRVALLESFLESGSKRT